MAMTANQDLKVSQLDVENAFLYGTLDETEIYMQQPKGRDDGSGRVCKLVKSLYGLKQAPLIWYYHIEQHLTENGWEVCVSDWALFKLTKEGETCWLLLYVDDILIFSKSSDLVKQAEDTLINKYKMHKEDLSKYLSINITIELGKVQLGLEKYIEKLNSKFSSAPTLHTQIPLGVDPNTDSVSEDPSIRGHSPLSVHHWEHHVCSIHNPRGHPARLQQAGTRKQEADSAAQGAGRQNNAVPAGHV